MACWTLREIFRSSVCGIDTAIWVDCYGTMDGTGMTSLQPRGSNARTVLLNEDNEDTRQFVEDLLIMSGYAVLGAASGQAGLAHVAAQRVDVILLDRRL